MKKAAIFCSLLLLFTSFLNAQERKQPPRGWHLMDLAEDSVFGISMEKVYEILPENIKTAPVIVAVIDGGIDLNHEDLKRNIYTNPWEKEGNKKDDDNNGFVDDVNGWNFLGSSKGSFRMDNIEPVRQLRTELSKDKNSPAIDRLRAEINGRLGPLKSGLKPLESKLELLKTITSRIGKECPSLKELKSYVYRSHAEEQVLVEMVKAVREDGTINNYRDGLTANIQKYKENIEYQLNVDYDPRTGPEYKKRNYGNPDSKGFNPFHGTHAAGIIAAVRDNCIGIQGIADNALLMPIRIVPDGGEMPDEDIAVAIRYAVDNGARIINMSLGKSTSGNPALVDEAVKYATEKDVLIVHAAGNDSQNLEFVPVYPNRYFQPGGEPVAWIEVGASGYEDNANLLAEFSNYSSTKVDVCAPGVAIYSTWTDNKYESINGTSMAAPMVSGIAAMLRTYYPKLTALQVKDIIMKSVIKRDVLKDKCISGGVVNAYEAFKLAADH